MIRIVCILLAITATIAFTALAALGDDKIPAEMAAAVLGDKSFMATLLEPEFFSKVTGIVTAMYFLLYGLAECLTRLSVWIGSKGKLGKAAKLASDLTWILGSIVGKFGYSVPKLVLEEKAKQLEEEKKKSG